jgi:hypothetical protein
LPSINGDGKYQRELYSKNGIISLLSPLLDPDRTDDDLDRQVELCRERIRSAGAAVECLAAAEGMVIDL